MNKKIKALLLLSFLAGCSLAGLKTLQLLGMIEAFRVPTSNNAPTLVPGDLILAEGFTPWLGALKHGQLVSYRADGIPGLQLGVPPGRRMMFIQRLVGLPGDRLQLKSGKLLVNDEPAQVQPGYVSIPAESSFPTSISLETEYIVPAGYAFMLGDNSANSLDSRYFGPVEVQRVTGVYLCHYWWAKDRGSRGKSLNTD